MNIVQKNAETLPLILPRPYLSMLEILALVFDNLTLINTALGERGPLSPKSGKVCH